MELGTDVWNQQVSVLLLVTFGGTVCNTLLLLLYSPIRKHEYDCLDSLDISTWSGPYTTILRPSLRQTRRDIRSNPHNSILPSHPSTDPRTPLGDCKTDTDTERRNNKRLTEVKYRLPRPRRPPSRSLLRQARGPACCCHGSGLNLSLFRQHRYQLERRGRKPHCTAKGFRVQRESKSEMRTF